MHKAKNVQQVTLLFFSKYNFKDLNICESSYYRKKVSKMLESNYVRK